MSSWLVIMTCVRGLKNHFWPLRKNIHSKPQPFENNGIIQLIHCVTGPSVSNKERTTLPDVFCISGNRPTGREKPVERTRRVITKRKFKLKKN